MTHPSEPAPERGEVEGMRAAAAPPSAILVCVAPGDDDGWHVYHRIENVSVIEQENGNGIAG